MTLLLHYWYLELAVSVMMVMTAIIIVKVNDDIHDEKVPSVQNGYR